MDRRQEMAVGLQVTYCGVVQDEAGSAALKDVVALLDAGISAALADDDSPSIAVMCRS